MLFQFFPRKKMISNGLWQGEVKNIAILNPIELRRSAITTRCAAALRYFPSMRRIKNWSNKQQMSSTKSPLCLINILIKTLSEEFKPVVLESYEFEKRQNKHSNWTLSHIQPIDIPIKGIQLAIRPSQSHINFCHCQLRLWLEYFISIVFEKNELEKQDISILIALLQLLINQISNFDAEDKLHIKYKRLLPQMKSYRLTLWWKNEAHRTEKKEFVYWDKQHAQAIPVYQDSTTWKKKNDLNWVVGFRLGPWGQISTTQ